jgi:hypothetical protein
MHTERERGRAKESLSTLARVIIREANLALALSANRCRGCDTDLTYIAQGLANCIISRCTGNRWSSRYNATSSRCYLKVSLNPVGGIRASFSTFFLLACRGNSPCSFNNLIVVFSPLSRVIARSCSINHLQI